MYEHGHIRKKWQFMGMEFGLSGFMHFDSVRVQLQGSSIITKHGGFFTKSMFGIGTAVTEKGSKTKPYMTQ